MKVQNMQNNSYNGNFGARFQLGGAVQDLPQELITKFEKAASSIGNDKDIISLNIGKIYKNTVTWSEMGERFEATNYWRDNQFATYINGELKQDIVSTHANNWGVKKDLDSLSDGILKYLTDLAKSVKKS